MGTAIAAEALAKKLKFVAPEEVFMCGLIHDVGKLVLLMIDKNEFYETCGIAKEKGLTFNQVELTRDVPLHTHCGQILAKKWALPDLLQFAIRDHHSPNPKLRSSVDPEVNRIVDLIFVSNQILHFLNYGNSGYDVLPNFAFDVLPNVNAEVLSRLGLKVTEMDTWMKTVKDSLSHADSMIQDLIKPHG